MKKAIFILILLCVRYHTLSAQDCDIALTAIVTPTASGIHTPQADSYLTNKLRNLVCQSTKLSSMSNEQFAIAATYDVTSKEIISGAPTKIIYNISLNLYIVDLRNSKIYSSHNIELKGIGDNETKALTSCYKAIDINNAKIKSFVKTGKSKIIDYYNKNYKYIINSAKKLASLKNYDEAIYQLSSIPECCIGSVEVRQVLIEVYQQFVNQHCAENLAQAKAAWYSSPNSDGASVASVFLSEIYPDAACYSEAMALYKEIKKKLGEDWKFTMKQYQDMIALEQQRINVMRDIAIAYANSRPKENVNIFWK